MIPVDISMVRNHCKNAELKSFFKISAIGVELKAICSILSNRGVELLQSFSSFKGIYQTLF